jgi:2'-5' RNA ligase
MRAFTAVDIEDREILLKLKEISDELDYGFNQVKPEKMHITLQFFQEITDKETDKVIEAMKNTDLNPFILTIKGAGVFPSKDHIRVVWAGIQSEEIFELKKQVSDHSVESDNDHEFLPHITLARVNNISRRDKKEFRKKLDQLQNKNIGKLRVEEVKLFESVRKSNGVKYRTLEKISL